MLEIAFEFRRVPHFNSNRCGFKLVEVLQEPQIVSEFVLLLQMKCFKDIQILKVQCMHIYMPTSSLFSTKHRLFLRRTEHHLAEILDSVRWRLHNRRELLMNVLEFFDPFVEVVPNTWCATLVTGVKVPLTTDHSHLLFLLGVLLFELAESLAGLLLDHAHKNADLGVDEHTLLWILELLEHELDDGLVQGFNAFQRESSLLEPTAIHHCGFSYK